MWTNEGPNLYLTEDHSAVVTADDPRARYLFCAQGSQIEQAEAEKYGLVSPVKAQPPANKAKLDQAASKGR